MATKWSTSLPFILAALVISATLFGCSRGTPQAPAEASTPAVTPAATEMSLAQRQRLFNQIWDKVDLYYVSPDFRGTDWKAVKERYAPRVGQATTTQVFYETMQAMLAEIKDEYMALIPPQMTAQDSEQIIGIGIGIDPYPEGLLIVRTIPGGPADLAGLKERDMILAIDGTPTQGGAEKFQGYRQMILGQAGTTVELSVRSPGEEPRQVSIRRAPVDFSTLQSVEARRLPDGKTGYLAIYSYDPGQTEVQAGQEIEKLQAAGGLAGLIVDVRHAREGDIGTLLNTLAVLSKGGEIGTFKSRSQETKQIVRSDKMAKGIDQVPLAVLIDEEGGLLSEMFAGGLRILRQAKVVGKATTGDQEVVQIESLFDGSQLIIPISIYYLPDGSTPYGRGLQPDQVVDELWWNYSEAEDPQILAAMALFK